MAKIKSIKFYDLTVLPSAQHGCIHINFYDTNKNLIPLDFSKPLSTPTTTHCETSEYIVTSDSSNPTAPTHNEHYNYNSFHTGNFDKTIGLSKIGGTWLPPGLIYNSSNWLKIEFKFPQYFSSIKVSGTIINYTYTKSFSYDVEYEDSHIETHNFEFDYDTPIPIDVDTFIAQTYDQNLMNSYLRDIDFEKSANIYDTKIGYIETLDTNNFRNIPINSIKKLKSSCINPLNTHLNCLISFDKKQTWKTFDGTDWIEISDISPENIILNGMEVSGLDSLDKNKLISGGFTGDLDFKIAMKTNDKNKTPSVTKIYIEYKQADFF